MDREYRILIVEDQRVTASVLTTSLELLNRGYHIVDFPSGEEALLEISRDDFDLIVTNDRLPGVQGLELIKRVREQHPNIKAILLTDQDHKKREKESEGLNLKAILTKPVDADEFTEAVNRALHSIDDLEDFTIVVEDKLGPLPSFDQQPIANKLPTLRKDLGAIALAFVSRNGKIKLTDGELPGEIRFNDLAVLLASNFTTTAEISAYLGGADSPSVYYHRGDSYDIFALSVGEHYFLTIIYPGDSQREMGSVLRYGSRGAQEISEHIKSSASTVEQTSDTDSRPDTKPKKSDKKTSQTKEVKDKAEETEPAPKANQNDNSEIDMSEYIMYELRGEEAKLAIDDEPKEAIELDDSALDELDDIDLNELGDTASFWEEAAEDLDKVRADTLSLDEAIELGLIDTDE